MKRYMIHFVIMLSIGLLSVVSLAQDDSMSTFDFENSEASIMFPDDWEQTVDDDGVLELSTDGINLMVYDADTLMSLFEVDEAESPEDLLTMLVNSIDDVELDADNIKVAEMGEREVARIAFETDDATGAVIALPMDDDSLGLVMFTMTGDTDDDLSALVDEILASFNVAEDTASGEACILSTTESNTVQIRVGPGLNRSVIAFLPAMIDFDAQGQTTDDDGNIWFRVAQEEAAPTKAVNETWIAGDDVDQNGDCDSVQDALAPPIIPIRQTPPTPMPDVASDTTDSDTATDSTADTTEPDTPTDTTTTSPPVIDASGAIIPIEGNWFLSFDIGSANCDGFSSTYDSGFGSFTSTMVGGGSGGLFFDGFMSYIGNNTYEDSSNVVVSGGTIPARFTVTITSERSATGSMGFVVDSCTAFVPFTINYTG